MDNVTLISVFISIGLLITNIISIYLVIYYKKKDYTLTVEKTLQISDKIFIFLSRDSMLKYLHSMYERAESGEIIWGQSVSGNIYGDVEGKIGLAATRGVKFEMIFNSEVDNKNGISLKKNLKKLFEMLNATVCIRNDNNLRIQGLSSKEVVIALPNNNKYYAILIKDSALTKALYYWFQSRLS